MTSEKLKPTPGPWRIDRFLGVLVGEQSRIIGGEDDLLLCAEAGTVHHECGLSPRELLEGYRNLQAAISDYLERQDDLDNREYHGINAEPQDTLMRRRNYARDDLDSVLAKHKEV